MIRDPFYRDIERTLGETLDPEVFERCAADVLRAIHPTLVPIPGGDDGGMDGAIADSGGVPFPLITTTAQDVSGNLRRNMKSYLGRGGKRRVVVVATSQALTARRRQNLEKTALELDFTVLQIHDRSSFVDLLYRQPRWCRELLGLTGDPPALSVVPLPNRPLIGDGLVGRAADLKWLSDTAGDVLIVGQPGSGKTFLLYRHARDNGGLFIHTRSLEAIASGLREQAPSMLIVDDAHLSLDFIPQLRRLRAETGNAFRIVATSWPGGRDEIMFALDVPSNAVRQLELLSRDHIAEIIKNLGIHGPAPLVQEIVDQAEGKPGLAVTLGNLCLRGGVKDLIDGGVLAREIATVFTSLVGVDVVPLLAGFAVGGDAGMAMLDVAHLLGVSLMDIHAKTAKLAAGGVLVEVGRERLAVRPPALRHALVGSEFFGGANALPINGLLAATPDTDESILVLVGARRRGAPVPSTLIRTLVASSRTPTTWGAVAGVGRDEVMWMSKEHPLWLSRIGSAALYTAADLGLPPLLGAAVGDTRELHSTTNHPLRIISDWIKSARPGTKAVIERRSALCTVAALWLERGGDLEVGLHALAISLSPEFEAVEQVPGSGRTITFMRGFATAEDVRQIRGLWPRVRAYATAEGVTAWRPLQRTIESWAHPGTHHAVADDVRVAAKALAAEMMSDLVSIGCEHPGVVEWARRRGRDAGLDVEAPPEDVAFVTLFPDADHRDHERDYIEQATRAKALAEEWAREPESAVVDRILSYEREAQLVPHTWPRLLPQVAQRIAELCESPEAWIDAIVDRHASPELLEPLMKRVLRAGGELAMQVARRCLSDELYRLVTAMTLLTDESTPMDLLDDALVRVAGGSEWIRTLCLRGEMPDPVLGRLLKHADDGVASATAIGMWERTPGHEIPTSHRTDWEDALMRRSDDDYAIRRIVKTDKQLAKRWLLKRLAEGDQLWRLDEAIGDAVDGMSLEDRRELLPRVPQEWASETLVSRVVGENVELFRTLLAGPHHRAVKLAPLTGPPNEAGWVEKAAVALDSGYSEEDVARAALGSSMEWSGDESEMWERWIGQFEELRPHADPRIRRIGDAGITMCEARRQRAREAELRERVRGL